MGYHERDIPQGILGDRSKVIEEMTELLDSVEQDNPVMALIEMADLIGALEMHLEKYHPSITLKDLITMKDRTRKAFESGSRPSK
jgi:hypothetical protein